MATWYVIIPCWS